MCTCISYKTRATHHIEPYRRHGVRESGASKNDVDLRLVINDRNKGKRCYIFWGYTWLANNRWLKQQKKAADCSPTNDKPVFSLLCVRMSRLKHQENQQTDFEGDGCGAWFAYEGRRSHIANLLSPFLVAGNQGIVFSQRDESTVMTYKC